MRVGTRAEAINQRTIDHRHVPDDAIGDLGITHLLGRDRAALPEHREHLMDKSGGHALDRRASGIRDAPIGGRGTKGRGADVRRHHPAGNTRAPLRRP